MTASLRLYLRRKLAETFAPDLAERMFQVDKCNKLARLADLPEAARAVYLERAVKALIDVTRMTDVNAAIAHVHALKEKEQADVDRQARQDIKTYGSQRTH